jgi:hypothetical protein
MERPCKNLAFQSRSHKLFPVYIKDKEKDKVKMNHTYIYIKDKEKDKVKMDHACIYT